ncbi:hypothetical protein HBI67_126330 [Parastagonospora nodorum]|nr:hypothetical protein HBI71_145620 [Parastagonospora nodorum]KAH6065305.1 hypothetical protein HBI67_126330 [Parastagonospora nodorum]KAH6075950.1 hypothetical protein HBI66_096100 [Parastagonospora nodorum]
MPPPQLPTLLVQLIRQQQLQRAHLGPLVPQVPLRTLRNMQVAQAAEVPLVKQRPQLNGREAAIRIDARLARTHERECLKGFRFSPAPRIPIVWDITESRVDVIQRDAQTMQVRTPVQHAVEPPVFDSGQVAEFHDRQRTREILQQRPHALVIEARTMQDTNACERGREVTEVLEDRRPADVHSALLCFVGRVAAREVKLAQLRQLANRLVEALEGNRFGHEGKIQDTHVYAFTQRRPAINRKRGLGRNERL